jgi:hypothetical protein
MRQNGPESYEEFTQQTLLVPHLYWETTRSFVMRMKLIAGALAAATALTAIAAPAQARPWGHRGGGGAIVGGLLAGALIGGAIASSQGGYYGPGYAPGYYAPAPVYAGPPGDAVGYCLSRFKSYDPASGTYLGYDGYRHPCP